MQLRAYCSCLGARVLQCVLQCVAVHEAAVALQLRAYCSCLFKLLGARVLQCVLQCVAVHEAAVALQLRAYCSCLFKTLQHTSARSTPSPLPLNRWTRVARTLVLHTHVGVVHTHVNESCRTHEGVMLHIRVQT